MHNETLRGPQIAFVLMALKLAENINHSLK